MQEAASTALAAALNGNEHILLVLAPGTAAVLVQVCLLLEARVTRPVPRPALAWPRQGRRLAMSRWKPTPPHRRYSDDREEPVVLVGHAWEVWFASPGSRVAARRRSEHWFFFGLCRGFLIWRWSEPPRYPQHRPIRHPCRICGFNSTAAPTTLIRTSIPARRCSTMTVSATMSHWLFRCCTTAMEVQAAPVLQSA